ncbi:MAG: HutD family protein [Ilumatobacteraceae bacterium]
MKIQRNSEHVAMPWANGRGTSYEIASDRGSDDQWSWRLAMAPVNEDGPFSRIDCVNRSLVVVEGAGMVLSVDRKKLQCAPLQVVQFRGEAVTDAILLDGPITDINLMIRRNDADGELRIVHQPGALASASIIVAVNGPARVQCDETLTMLERHDAMLECDANSLVLVGGSVCVVSVQRR